MIEVRLFPALFIMTFGAGVAELSLVIILMAAQTGLGLEIRKDELVFYIGRFCIETLLGGDVTLDTLKILVRSTQL